MTVTDGTMRPGEIAFQTASLGSRPWAAPQEPLRGLQLFGGMAWEVTRRSGFTLSWYRTKRADQLIMEVSKSAFILPFSMPARSFPLMYTLVLARLNPSQAVL